MTTQSDTSITVSGADAARGIFRDIIVGVDGSPAAHSALHLALQLRADGGRLLGLSIAEVHHAAHTGIEAPSWTGWIRAAAEEIREETLNELDDLPNVAVRAMDGRPADALLAAARSRQADLIAIGAGRAGRASGLVFGSTATRILRESPTSVLVVPADFQPVSLPRRIVVGVDGSAHSADAEAVGHVLADSFAARLRRIVATGGQEFDPERPVQAEVTPDAPVTALVEASRDADLVIVGSRGLRGLSALGSVAERVAHRAESPVLVVRLR